MEHKLILGGEQWLSFARSRIAAIRQAGTLHATQNYTMGDGAFVQVRVVMGDSYIYITGGTVDTPLDSGLVEAFNAGSSAYSAATLYECGTYQSAFVPTVPPTKWRLRPGTTSEGQLAGLLELKNRVFKGKVPYDAQPARSLSPGKVLNVTNSAYITNTKDELLASKKAVLSSCPASMFTGRCRLYVQALYGAYLYKDDKLNASGDVFTAGDAIPLPYSLGAVGASGPTLRLNSYKTDEDKALVDADYDYVTINTSTGVYFDPLTGKHWLITMDDTTITEYPLIGNVTAEHLRKYLWDSPSIPEAKRLNTTDREHLEAYILSTCLPRARARKRTVVTSVPSGALGYGWHWNWKGDEAHIVVVTTRSDTPDVPGTFYQVSTHYRRTANPTHPDDVYFSWVTSIVEGPVNWSVFRANWCFTQPFWSTPNTHQKFTSKVAPIFACDAPFYVFYKRDELQVCRIKVEALPVDGPTRNAEPSIFGPVDSEEWTLGMENGYQENTSDGMSSVYHGTYYKATLTVGATVMTDLTVGLLRNGTRHDVKDKVVNSFGLGFASFSSPDHMVDLLYGDPIGFIPFSYNGDHLTIAEHFGPGAYYEQLANMNYTYETSDVTDSRTDLLTVIIPWYDAEALFVRASATRNYLKTGITREIWGKNVNSWVYGNHATSRIEGSSELFHHPVVEYYWWRLARVGGSDVLSSTSNPPDELTTTVLQDNRKLFCRAGALDVDFTGGNLADFHDNELDEVTGVYNATSGTSTSEPVVLANQRITPVGTHGHDAVNPALLGWV